MSFEGAFPSKSRMLREGDICVFNDVLVRITQVEWLSTMRESDPLYAYHIVPLVVEGAPELPPCVARRDLRRLTDMEVIAWAAK